MRVVSCHVWGQGGAVRCGAGTLRGWARSSALHPMCPPTSWHKAMPVVRRSPPTSMRSGGLFFPCVPAAGPSYLHACPNCCTHHCDLGQLGMKAHSPLEHGRFGGPRVLHGGEQNEGVGVLMSGTERAMATYLAMTAPSEQVLLVCCTCSRYNPRTRG